MMAQYKPNKYQHHAKITKNQQASFFLYGQMLVVDFWLIDRVELTTSSTLPSKSIKLTLFLQIVSRDQIYDLSLPYLPSNG